MPACTIPKRCFRKDKYGQNFRLECGCGQASAWHTSFERAAIGLAQNHAYVREHGELGRPKEA